MNFLLKKVLISFIFIFALGSFYQISVDAEYSGETFDENDTVIEESYFEEEITPMAGNPYYTWAITSSTITGTTYGTFKACGSGRTPSTISCGGSSSVSSTYSGSLAVPLKTLQLSVGVTFNESKGYNHNWSKTFNTVGHYEAIVRPAYTNYRVVQTQYMHLDGQKIKTSTTKVIIAKRYSHLDYSWRAI